MDYFDQSYTLEFEEACTTRRYDKVLILPPWKKIYVADNERLESFEEAIEIHEHLKNTYLRYDYDPVLIPTSTVKERITCVLNALKENF